MGSNAGPSMEVAKPAIFNGEAGKVGGFITSCRLYIKMKLRGNTVEEQVQWALTYVQGGSADIWKENLIEELESGEVEFESVEEFFTGLRKEFGGGEEESVKAAELRKLEQGGKTMEEFVQEFKRAARGSGYEGRPLVEEFKRGINGGIRRKLMEAENPPTSIEQWYRRATALDRNWRESRREEERLKKKEVGGGNRNKDKSCHDPWCGRGGNHCLSRRQRGLLQWKGLKEQMRWLSGDRGRGQGFLQDGIPLQWKWIGEGIALLAGDLGTWLVIVETEGEW